MWLTEDWTNDRDKWISLNTRFYNVNHTRKVYGCRIIIVVSRLCSLCWVLKVGVVECLRLNASRRWEWSLCLVQIVAVDVWSVCRCCWRQSMMWMHRLQRLDYRCPVLFNPWLTGCMSMWPRGVGASSSCVVTCRLGCCRCCYLIAQKRLMGWACLQLVLLLDCAGMAAKLSWSWSAVGVGCCIVVLGYLPGRCSD